ncbi:MAG: Lrp/AsnC family transcriptional regulator [Synergistaceae bacterium]|jgi:Lrp/AsnC family leucine-responsive transcriptional regulator|nr:Lrp/AsnC family transcriptional regulator [Synergistaceae bacterium]MCK9558480.1 Lrp/AsnC family transcriptional regulator [Candidatus Cloacimonadota bacterium]
MMAPRKSQLDSTDWKILAELQEDARKTYQEIGDAVGMTRPAVRERILRLEESGVITGYRTEISPSAAGRALHAMLVFKFSPDSDFDGKKPNDVLMPLLNSSSNVVRYWVIYGDLDFLIETASATKEDLDALVNKLRNYGFVRTHIIVWAVSRPYRETRSEG